MSEKINYQDECSAYLRLKANGEKVTQAKYCQMRSKELGKPVSLAYFKKIMRVVKGKLTSKQSKSNAPGHKATQKVTLFNWESLKADFMAGPYRSVAQFGRECGIAANTQLYEKAKGWRKEKSKAGLIPRRKRLRNQAAPQKVGNNGSLAVRVVIRCPPGASIIFDVESSGHPVHAAMEVPDEQA